MTNLNVLPIAFFFLLFPFMGWSQNPSDTTLARQYLDSAKMLINTGQVEKALKFGEQALDIYKVVYGSKDTIVANACTSIAIKLENSNNFSESLEYYEKVLNIYLSDSTNLNPKVCLIYDRIGVVHSKKGEFADAEKNLKKALELGIETYGKNDPDVITIYYNLGLVYENTGRYDEALELLNIVLNIRLETLDEAHPDIAYSYNIIGNIYKTIGEFEKALNNYNNALEVFDKIQKENHAGLAYIYNNIGGVYEATQEYNKALEYRQKALDINLYNYNENHPEVARSLTNVGVIYYFKNEFNKTLEYYQRALKIQFKVLGENHPDVGRSYNNIGLVHLELGELYKALEYFQKSRQIHLNFFEEVHPLIATSYGNIGIIYNNLGEHDKALEFANKSLNIRKELFGDNHLNVATSHMNIGVIYLNKQDYPEALAHYNKALEIGISNLGEINPGVASVYSNIGNVYIKTGEYAQSLKYHEKSLDIRLNTLGDTHLEVAYSYANLGAVYSEFGDFNKAVEYYMKSKEVMINILGEEHPDIAELDYYLSKSFWSLKNYTESLKFQELALKNIGSLQKRYSTSKNLHFAESIPLFEMAIGNYIEADKLGLMKLDLKTTFKYSENAKSKLLLGAFHSSKAKSFSNIPGSILDQEAKIQSDIAYFEKMKQNQFLKGLSETDSTYLATTSELFVLNNQYEELILQLEKTYPKYYRAKYDFSTVDVDYVQNELLKQDQSLLEYFVGDSSIFIFLVQKDHYEVHEVKHDFPLKDWVQEMTKEGIYGYYTVPSYERTRQLEEKTIVSYTNAAQKLYEKLIAPVADRLTENLIIIPDGILGYVPFEALLTEAPPKLRVFKAYPFLIKKHQISYCYSATLLKEMRQKQHREKPSDHLLAMAPFFMGDVSELVARIDTTDLVANITLRDSLLPLPNSGEEVATVNKLWNGISVFGTDASLSEFQQKAEKYRILHLSTHGKADDRVGDYAYLAFGVPDEKGTFDKLYARDLYNYSLNADMVVLSACETGIGKLQRGEGIISLARAFAYAGAKSIFTTLWQVSDENTKDIFVDFYKYLKAGKPKDEALRLAKLDYLEKHAGRGEGTHPFFWAGLIGIGDMSPLAD